MEKKQVKLSKIIINIIALAIFLIVFVLLTIFFINNYQEYIKDPLKYRDFIQSKGSWGVLIFLLLQVMQVVVSVIPGEFVETAGGLLYGWFGGFLLLEVGLFIGTCIIYLISKKLGKPLVDDMFSKGKWKYLSKIDDNPKKRDNALFLIFLIPGLPKDILTYYAAFSNIKFGRFLWITMIARVPSVISSTIAGNYIIQGKYWLAVIIYLVTGVIAIAGYLLVKKLNAKESFEKEKSEMQKDEV